jgi:hypothetical protein
VAFDVVVLGGLAVGASHLRVEVAFDVVIFGPREGLLRFIHDVLLRT